MRASQLGPSASIAGTRNDGSLDPNYYVRCIEAGTRNDGSLDPNYYVRCIEDIPLRQINWLWRDRLALGKVNLIAGQPGMGKSQISLWMAGIVSVGAKWPDGSQSPSGNIVLVTCEDDAADTVKPRLDATRAANRKIFIFDGVPDEHSINGKRMFLIDRDVDSLAQLCEDIGNVKLIIIDPVSAYMGAGDSHKTSDVRAALLPMQLLAQQIDACVLIVTHLNKGTEDGSAISRVSGSGAYVAAARSAWLVGPHPNDTSRRVLTPLKNNIGDDKTGFSYQITPVTLPNGVLSSCVEFDREPIRISAEEALTKQEASRTSAKAEAAEFLIELLTDGPQEANHIFAKASEAGIAEKTLRRACRQLNLKIRKAPVTGKSTWELRELSQLGQLGHSQPTDFATDADRNIGHAGQVGQVERLRTPANHSSECSAQRVPPDLTLL